MRFIVLLVFSLFVFNRMEAQIMEDDFESNQFGWTESAGKRGIAIIRDGVLHMESKGTKPLTSTCYAPFDISKPFYMQVDALVDKVNNDKFGILLDYEDDQNYILFYVFEGEAKLEVYREGKIIGRKEEAIKLNKGKKIGVTFEVDYKLNEMEFKVNGIRAMTFRRRITKDEFLLGTSGIGFFAKGGQVIDFDNLKITQ